MAKKSIAILGEGETEWFYFDSLRMACRYPFKISPSIPKHTDITHMLKTAEMLACQKDYDYVVCLVDMDRLLTHEREMTAYKHIRDTCSDKIRWIETSPCTEYWFLLHFLPELSVKHYKTCDDLLPDLQKHLPGYSKTAKYLSRINLFEYLRRNGNLELARKHAEQLDKLNSEHPEDMIAYSQIHKVLNLLEEMVEPDGDDEGLKMQKSDRIGEVEAKIIDFLANSADSDAKSISKAIGLRASRTGDYLRRLSEFGLIECIGE